MTPEEEKLLKEQEEERKRQEEQRRQEEQNSVAATTPTQPSPTNTDFSPTTIAPPSGTVTGTDELPTYRDTARDTLVEAQKQRQQSFSDILNAYKTDYDREQQESLNAQKANVRAARWAGATELAASLANLFAVGEGNAVSQVYQPVSQDWMQRAEEESRYRRSRIDDIRQRQRAMEMQMAQMRSEEALQLAKYDQDKQARDMEYALNQARVEYQNAQTAYYNARTEAEKQEADQKAKEAEKKLQYLEEQINAQKALANSRNASAYSSRTRADAQASGVANQNSNRDSRTASQNAVDLARAGYWSSKAGTPQYSGARPDTTGLQYRVTPSSEAPATASDDNTAPFRKKEKEKSK